MQINKLWAGIEVFQKADVRVREIEKGIRHMQNQLKWAEAEKNHAFDTIVARVIAAEQGTCK